MASIRFTRRAVARLRHIGEWIEKDDPAAAQRVLSRIASRYIGLLRLLWAPRSIVSAVILGLDPRI